VKYRQPFDFDAVLGWLAARAIPGVERVEEGAYIRGAVRVWHEAGEVRTTGEEQRVRRLFDLDFDPAPMHALFARDRMLGPLLRDRPGVRVPGAWDPFELAVRAIVGQQVSVAGARTILGRIGQAHGFDPAVLADVTLAGMPRSRAATIQRLAQAVINGDRDAFPAGDLILRRHAGDLSERELLRKAERWRPYRAYAAMLLWTR
jgi:AraC family transcriptional regulator of adaptative response / DNA-3-methyladenine glycosylase II